MISEMKAFLGMKRYFLSPPSAVSLQEIFPPPVLSSERGWIPVGKLPLLHLFFCSWCVFHGAALGRTSVSVPSSWLFQLPLRV